MFDINGWEFIILLILGFVLVGPERLPGYAAKLAQLARQLKVMAQNAQEQLKEQMGPEFGDVDWKQYDPRQYDPRRIIREALLDDPTVVDPPAAPQSEPMSGPPAGHDPDRPTPWDPEST